MTKTVSRYFMEMKDMGDKSEYKKPHPFTILHYLQISVIFIILSLFQQVLFTPTSIVEMIASLGITALYVFVSLFYAFYFYRRQSFRIDDNGIRVKKGVYIRMWFTVPYEKIQTIVIKKDIMASLFGAVRVAVDTVAGSSRRYDIMAYLSRKRTRNMLERLYREHEISEKCGSDIVSTVLMSFFWSNPVKGLIFIFPVTFQMQSIIGREMTNSIVSGSFKSGQKFMNSFFSPTVAVLAVFIMGGWVLSIIMTFLRYVRFRSYRTGEFIGTSRGLFNKSILLTRESGIAAITVDQSLLMWMIRICSAGLFVIGSGKIKGDKSLLLAPESIDKIHHNIHRLTGFSTDESRTVKTARNTLIAYIRLPFVLFICCCGAYTYFSFLRGYWEIARFIIAIMIIIDIWWLLFRIFAHRKSHIGISSDKLVLCGFKGLNVKKYIIPSDKITRTEISQNYFQRLAGTCSLRAYMFAEKRAIHTVRHLDKKETEELLSEFFGSTNPITKTDTQPD